MSSFIVAEEVGSGNASVPVVPPDGAPAVPAEAPTCSAAPSLLAVEIDGEETAVDLSRLPEAEYGSSLRRQLVAAQGPVVFVVRGLATWPASQRFCFWRLLEGLSAPYVLRFAEDGQVFNDPLRAALAAMVGPTDLRLCSASRAAAVEAASVFHRQDPELAANLILARLKQLDVPGLTKAKLVKDIVAAGHSGQQDPTTAAWGFLNYLKPANLASEQTFEIYPAPYLRYFRQDFYLWEEDRWRRLPDDEIENRVTAFLQIEPKREVTKKYVADVLVNLRGYVALHVEQSLPFLVESERPLHISISPRIAFRNGLLDLGNLGAEEGLPDLQAHDRRYFSTVVLPFDYDPAAECYDWLEFLGQILLRRDPADRRIEVLQEFMGLSIVAGDCQFEKLLILVGDGANGKSVICRVWEELLGRDNVAHVPLDQFGGEYRLYELEGKLANLALDMNWVNSVAEGILKQIVSGEPLQVNRKYRKPCTIRPTARLVFSTNRLPSFSDGSDGIWRRVIVLPFAEQFREAAADTQLSGRLLEELPGIFNWAVRGAQRLYRQRGFTPCTACGQAVADHRFDCDPVAQFVDEWAELGERFACKKADLYKAYAEFCKESGRKALRNTEFGKRLLTVPGVSEARESRGARDRQYRGIALNYDQALRLRSGPWALSGARLVAVHQSGDQGPTFAPQFGSGAVPRARGA